MEGWNWEYIHIWRICGRLKGNKGGVLDVTATEVDKCRPAGFQPVLSFLEQVCVHAGGHNGRVMKGLFQLCIYELLTCHLIYVRGRIKFIWSIQSNQFTVFRLNRQHYNMNTNDTICKYKLTCQEQYHQTGKMGHGVGSSYRHTDMFALHYAKWLSICLDYYSCALISLCSWKAFGCKVVWWCRMVLLGWLQMDQNYWEYLMEDISFQCPTFYSPFPH